MCSSRATLRMVEVYVSSLLLFANGGKRSRLVKTLNLSPRTSFAYAWIDL